MIVVKVDGMELLFMAAEVKAMFFGALGAKKIEHALKRILGKVKEQQLGWTYET